MVVQLGTKVEAAACSSVIEDGNPSNEVVIEAIFGRYTFCFERPRTAATSEQPLLLPSV